MKNKHLQILLQVTTLLILVFLVQVGVKFSRQIAENNIIEKTALTASVSNSAGNNLPSSNQLNLSLIGNLKKELLSQNSSYLRAPLAAKGAINDELVNLAQRRQTAALDLMKTDPALFLSQAIDKKTKSSLPTEVQNYIEEQKTFTGEINVLHVDDFKKPENSRFEYSLITSSGSKNLYPTKDLNTISGATVAVTGYALTNQLAFNPSINNFRITKTAPRPESVGDQRTLVLLLKPYPQDSEPFTTEQAHDLVFNGQFQAFMKQQSYGKVSFSGDVYGWFPMNRRLGTCDIPYGTELENIVNTYNLDLGNYDRLVFLMNDGGLGGCSSVGKYLVDKTHRLSATSIGIYGDYDAPSNWGQHPFKWTNLDYVLAHEIGHSLGLWHANSWICLNGEDVHGADCRHQEYGNYFDTMGTGTFSLDYNAYYKEMLGWISPAEILQISKSGSYFLKPLESAWSTDFADYPTRKLEAKINNGDTDNPYVLEFRKGIYFDTKLNNPDLIQNQNGLFVNYVVDGFTRLLDMSPVDNINNATMNYTPSGSDEPALTFAEPGRGITIGPVTNVSDSQINFNVDLKLPACERKDPLFSTNGIQVKYSGVPAGSYGSVNLYFTNNDYYGCGASDFEVNYSSPPGWKIYYSEMNFSLKPGEGITRGISFEVPVDTSVGTYSINFTVTNKISGLKKTVEIPVKVTEPYQITVITPNSGPAGTVVTVEGSAFSEGNQIHLFGDLSLDKAIVPEIVDSHNLKFKIPETMTVCDSAGKCTETKIPLGHYGIYAINSKGSATNTVNFELIEDDSPLIDSEYHHPADTNKDFRIATNEVVAFGLLVKQNGKYSDPAQNVWKKYLDSAQNIWRNGETYKWDSTQQDWVSVTTITAVSPKGGETFIKGNFYDGNITLFSLAPNLMVKLQLLQDSKLLGSFVQFYLKGNGPDFPYFWSVGEYYDANSNRLSAVSGSGYQIQAVLLDGNNVIKTVNSGTFTISDSSAKVSTPSVRPPGKSTAGPSQIPPDSTQRGNYIPPAPIYTQQTPPSPTPSTPLPPTPPTPPASLTITTASLPNATVGTDYSANVEATGGTESYGWGMGTGSFPPGLGFGLSNCSTNPCKAPAPITGTPNTPGTYTFSLNLYSGTQSTSKQFTITVGQVQGASDFNFWNFLISLFK